MNHQFRDPYTEWMRTGRPVLSFSQHLARFITSIIRSF